VWLIVGAAIVFRMTMLFSIPIQEVDIYRYFWDGTVTSQGISPFRYPPAQVLAADANDSTDPQLQRLTNLRDGNEAVAEVLRRIHFSELPTVYPPTSQAVFLISALTTPDDASVTTRVRIMKAWLTGFDLGVLFLVIMLLRISGLPQGLVIVYAWCPLVLKEIANSGHLDSIAVFLTTLAVYLLARALSDEKNNASNRKFVPFKLSIATFVLAAAVGAKLYPFVLAPMIFLTLMGRFGWRATVGPAVVFAVSTMLLLWPLLPTSAGDHFNLSIPIPTDTAIQPIKELQAESLTGPVRPGSIPANSHVSDVFPGHDPSLGITTFLRSWEMNDFIFMVLVENLKPASSTPQEQSAWFSVVPESFRKATINFASSTFSIPVSDTPFLVTRLLTTILWILIAIPIARRAAKRQTVASFCEASFLTLAWFWLLLPTQNPWYWLWAMPLLPFVRNRAWLAVSGLVLIYYLRFWLDYHFADLLLMGTQYHGTIFFDFVVIWLEFAPWFVWLAVKSLWRLWQFYFVAWLGSAGSTKESSWWVR